MTESTVLEPPTVHRGEAELPFVTFPDGTRLQLLQVDLSPGAWVVRMRIKPGSVVQRHRHTGRVQAFTVSGRWFYLESPDAVNTAGSFLYEPAGSTHTLNVPETNEVETDIWFTVSGANLNLDDQGNVVNVLDAHTLLSYYRRRCLREHGVEDPPVIVIDA